MNKRRKLLFSGLVQGVGFRFTARDFANKYKLKGWVKNLSDGRVELDIEGREDVLNNFLQDLQREFINNIAEFKQEEVSEGISETGFHIKF